MLRGSHMRAAVALLLLASCSSGPTGSTPRATSSACTYPPGPYGTRVGDVVDPSLVWHGYVDDSGQPTTISIGDFQDCEGTKGVRALLIDESATWCGDCVSEATQIEPLVGAKWEDEGVRVLTLMAQDAQESPATTDTALSWRNEFALTKGAVCADPEWTMKRWGVAQDGGDNGFPTNVLVDPRTMRIVAIQPPDLEGTVDNLARAND